MAKGLLIIVIFAVLALAAIANYPAPEGTEEAQDIAEAKAEIQVYKNKLMYDRAAYAYDELINDFPQNKELSDEYIAFCEEQGFLSYVQAECERRFAADKSDKDIALKLLDIYNKSESNYLYTFMDNNADFLSDTELYISIKQENLSKINYKGSSMQDVCDWSTDGYLKGKDRDGDDAVYSEGGSELFNAGDRIMMSYSLKENYAAVIDNEQAVYIDSFGNRQLVPYNSEEEALVYMDYVGSFTDGLANVCYEGKWGYMDTSMRYGYMNYMHTTPFSSRVSAVQEESGWSVLNYSYEKINSQSYEDVYRDEYGHCCFNGFIFLKSGGGWQLHKVEYNEDNKAVSLTLCGNSIFEDVKAFGDYGAVKKNGKWGFIKSDGSWLIEPAYEDAYSFRCGLAPVKKDGKWGYISEDAVMRIDAAFDDAISFSKKGVSAVKTEDAWRFIQLVEYYYNGR